MEKEGVLPECRVVRCASRFPSSCSIASHVNSIGCFSFSVDGVQGEVIVKVGDDCRRFYVVLGAPRELLDIGEIPAVSRETPSSTSNTTNGCRLLSGQFFGEKGLLRQAEVSLMRRIMQLNTCEYIMCIRQHYTVGESGGCSPLSGDGQRKSP